jgi:inorganic phosphate transporter, PiT family
VEYGLVFLIIACVVGLFMTWGVGANDLANIMSTTMGSKAISVKQALIIAVIFEFAGAILGGVHVSNTIRNGIINTTLLVNSPEILTLGMIATLCASAVWMLLASFIGMPVSITNAIVGALVGFGTIVLGIHAVHWQKIGVIALTWVFAPIVAGLFSYWLFNIVRSSILATSNPKQNAKKFLPFLFFLVGVVLAIMTVLKGLAGLGYDFNIWIRFAIVIVTALLVAFLGVFLCKLIPEEEEIRHYQRFEYVEKLFGILMAFTACAMVFAHGSNDVAIAAGPVAAVFSIVKHNGDVAMSDPTPLWILFMGCVGVIVGLFMYGRKVIATVGEGITALTPSRAFAATLAAAVTVIFATSSGIPVSATQTLVGGVLGVGLARGIGALNVNVIRNIFLSWLVTVPVTAFLAILFFDALKLLFHFI